MLFKSELLQADAVQKRALYTMTRPCAAGCARAKIYVALTELCARSSLSSRLMFPSSLLGGQDSLELSEVQKKNAVQFSNPTKVFMLPQSGNI